MSELVSVIMPVYNVEEFVGEALQSILNQTYKNIEVIVVDDGSTDGTYSIVKCFAENDKRVKLYRNEKNLKIVKTLNRALSVVKGDYILRMDGDDVSVENRLEVLMSFIKSNPQYSLVGSAYSGIDQDGKERGVSKVPTNQNLIDKTILLSSPVSHIWLATKQVYIKLNGYRANTVEDYDFLLRMYTNNIPFTNIPDVLYKVRLRDGNTASTQGLKQAKAHQYVLNLYKERLLKGSDSYSDEGFENAVRSTPLMEFLHTKSQKFLTKALQSNNVISKVFFVLISILLSQYTFRYILRRYRYKSIMKGVAK